MCSSLSRCEHQVPLVKVIFPVKNQICLTVLSNTITPPCCSRSARRTMPRCLNVSSAPPNGLNESNFMGLSSPLFYKRIEFHGFVALRSTPFSMNESNCMGLSFPFFYEQIEFHGFVALRSTPLFYERIEFLGFILKNPISVFNFNVA